jgi:AcrR family transcriptional regulator
MNMEDEEEHTCCPSLGFKPGRPRSEAARQAILRAAHTLLVRDGFAALTMEAITGEAGGSKATLYRWWPCKATVVMDGLLAATALCCAGPDTGDVREDLRRRMRGLTQVFSGCQGKVIVGYLPKHWWTRQWLFAGSISHRAGPR